MSKENDFTPRLVDIICERYDPLQNKWEELIIENAPKLGAFSWTRYIGDSILIFGGTDG